MEVYSVIWPCFTLESDRTPCNCQNNKDCPLCAGRGWTAPQLKVIKANMKSSLYTKIKISQDPPFFYCSALHNDQEISTWGYSVEEALYWAWREKDIYKAMAQNRK